MQILVYSDRHNEFEPFEPNPQQNAQALDLFAEELRLTQTQLNTITGGFSSSDLLGVIFSRFCIEINRLAGHSDLFRQFRVSLAE